MANLTGEYDVAVEVSVSAVNKILAALQENQDPEYPRLPHSIRMALDDTPRGPGDPVPASDRTGVQAAVEAQVSAPSLSLPSGWVIGDGIGWMARGLGGRWPGSERSDVTLQANIRAWIRADAESEPTLPEFIHGDLLLHADVVRTSFQLEPPTMLAGVGPGAARRWDLGGVIPPWGDEFVGVDRDSMSVVFQQAPGTTVSEEQRQRIQRIVLNSLRGDFDPITFKVSLPDDVRRWDYKLDPGRASVMVMVVVSDRGTSPNAPNSVAAGFKPAGADFGIAVGRDFLLPLMKSQLIRDFPPSYSFSQYRVNGTVRPDWPGTVFELQPGRIVARIHGSGEISWWGADDSFMFDIELAFGLHVVNGSVEPFAIGDPVVNLHDVAVAEGYIEGEARGRIRQERDKALAAARPQIREQLAVQTKLEDILEGFHPEDAQVAVTGVEIRPEGIVVSGRIGLAPTQPVVVRQVKREGMLDALESWVPGGTIDRFVWSRDAIVADLLARGGTARLGDRVEEHRFVTEELGPVPAQPLGMLRCLEVQGHRLTTGGQMAPVAGHTCGFLVPIPPWPILDAVVREGARMPLMAMRGIRPDGTVGIVGHYGPWAMGLAPSEGGTTMVVHLATGRWAETAKELQEGLKAVGEAAVIAVVLVPEGGLDGGASSIETGAALMVGEDVNGTWSRALDVSAPATVIVGPRGDIAWKDEGEFSGAKLARALGKVAEPGGKVTWRPLRLGVAADDRPPEFPIRLEGGGELSLRRVRGHEALVAFWTSWSQPSIEQLRELAGAYRASEGRRPIVLAVGDGETADSAARIQKLEQLPFPVIPDPDRRIAARYGVSCWPTTVWISKRMRVEAVTFGLGTLNGHGRDGGYEPEPGRGPVKM